MFSNPNGVMEPPAGRWAGTSPRYAVLLVMLAVLTLKSGLATAAPAAWTARVWQVDDGLPDSRVTGLAQAPDGAIWVATRGGLLRFNGVAFELFPLDAVQGVVGNGAQAMFAGSRGTLWLGAFREAALRIEGSSVQLFTTEEGRPAGAMGGFAESADGTEWLVFGGTVCRFDGGQFQVVEPPAGVEVGGRASVARDRDGEAWAALGGRVGILRPGAFEERFRLESREVVLAAARRGGLWAVSGPQVYWLDDDGVPGVRCELPPAARAVTVLEDSSGAVWIGTMAHGLFRFDGRQVELVETSHRHVASLLEDLEGNLWAGTVGGGLNRLRPRALELMGATAGLPSESVVSICQDSMGDFWAATAVGELVRSDSRSWHEEPAGGVWPGGSAACVAADRHGTLWIGTRGQGLHQVNLRGGRTRTWLQRDGLASNSVRALLVASDDSLWVATSGPSSLHNVSRGTVRSFRVPPTTRNIRTIVEDFRGGIWIGTSDGQVLTVVDDALVRSPGFPDSVLPSVRSLHSTADGSLWIGHASGGIGHFKDGKYTRLSAKEGLEEDSVWQLTSDRAGFLWLAGGHGVYKFSLGEAVAVAQGRQDRLRPMHFGRAQGLPNLQLPYDNGPAVCQSRDGRLLFATSSGVLALAPFSLQENRVAPPVMLERIVLDDRVVARRNIRFPLRPRTDHGLLELERADPALDLPPDHQRLTFAFAALSYSAPENVRFRYRLEGAESGWTESTRERTATYSRLPAGDYVFRVRASNDAGEWSGQDASVSVSVRPFFWQTWWFRTGMLGAFAAAGAAAVRLGSVRRLQSRLHRAEQQAALFQERTRIARDIHDDIGGSLAQIKLLSEMAQQDRTMPERPNDPLRQITGTAQGLLKSLDEIVWAVSPRNDTLPNLVSYLGQHAVRILRAAGIACQIEMPDAPPDVEVASDVRHHVFLVVKEALTNVVRHAGARAVRFQVTIAGDVLRVAVADDGRGFEHITDDALADGLRNMRQRMAIVGGKFAVSSRSGAGTRIQIELPFRPSA